ncbi:MAG: Smr/MutS family protein [Acidobacteria bacterium]|nr:Smr/MutS family protein [Acidobacteriota bacterium]
MDSSHRLSDLAELQSVTRRDLAWDQIKGYFGRRAQTAEGRRLISDQDLMDQNTLITHFEALNRWLEWLAHRPPFSFPALPAVSDLDRNPHLSPFSSEKLICFRDVTAFWLEQEEMPCERQPPSASFVSIHNRLKSLFTAQGTWSVDASPTYRKLISEQDKIHAQVERQLLQIIEKNRDVLSESIVFERNGRKVLAVQASFKGKLRGMVQDSSASGQSVFIEPESIIALQNREVELIGEIREELLRISREVTTLIVAEPSFSTLLSFLADMDRMQALALVTKETQSQVVVPNSLRTLDLKNARHPFLDAAYASLRQEDGHAPDDRIMVPFDLQLDAIQRGLLISGANTGGKTVTLKTTGLISLMANSGFPIPVSEGSQVPFYDTILADIGDHQSMAQSLSTFASHLKTLNMMANQHPQNALLLIDELGSGTDPMEADALSQALLERFMASLAHVICTTHHQVLCAFALEHPNLVNGSMAFNPQLMVPTFRFTQGVPERSHALEIAQQAGFPKAVMERAKSLLDNNMVDVQSAITQLQKQARELHRAKAKVRRKEIALHKSQKENEMRANELASKAARLEDQAQERLQNKLKQLERRVRGLMAELSSKKDRREAAQQFSMIEQEIQPTVEKIEIPSSGQPSSAWRPGDAVYVQSFARHGVLVAVDRKTARVNLNGMMLQASLDDVIHTIQTDPATPPQVKELSELSNNNPSLELKLLGMTVDDALLEVDRAIDLALRVGQPYLIFIHGHGSGRLKGAVRQFLQQHQASDHWDVVLNENDGQTELHFN